MILGRPEALADPLHEGLAGRDQRSLRLSIVGCGTDVPRFFQTRSGARIPAIGIDMSEAYVAGTTTSEALVAVMKILSSSECEGYSTDEASQDASDKHLSSTSCSRGTEQCLQRDRTSC